MSEYAARLALHGMTAERLDQAARSTPRLAAAVGQTVDAYVAAAGRMPNVGPSFQCHDAEIASRLRTHFGALFSSRIDASDKARAAEPARWEADLGLDARAMVGTKRVCACVKALMRRRPIGSRAVAEQGALIAQLLAFDLASTITTRPRRPVHATGTLGQIEAAGQLDGSPAHGAVQDRHRQFTDWRDRRADEPPGPQRHDQGGRAGEAGRGFAIVATEVKALADETTATTIRIERLFHRSMQADEPVSISR